ncbi:MAG: thymidine phosphorylase [Ignavibacteriales bacterium]|nr:MAG: thymidine phosphorylase [Ignavibacteriales bacterium]
MNTVELIRKKRNGEILTEQEIIFLIENFTKGKIPDYQFSAFLMAVYFKNMSKEETAALTRAMLYSGNVINLDSIPGAKVDKHSTGGVGDKTSLILAPIVAAAGLNVPMISGRGLGHTGGTLDKLESIPGFTTQIDLERYKSIISKCGAVLAGQTKDIAPADKLIYALRDVTATVESIPLITGSIMSKKLAEGIDGLVLDVKTGSGAFMSDIKDAQNLAISLMETAMMFDKKVISMVTDMNQPLGNYIGNWLEVYESVKVLQGENVPDLLELSLNLAGAMLSVGGRAADIEEGIEISKEMIKSGKAFDKFLQIVELQNGDLSFIKDLNKYPKSNIVEPVYSHEEGYFSKIDNYQLGMINLELGAGRLTKEDIIDPKAGIVFRIKLGDKVEYGEKIAEFHTDKAEVLDELKSRFNGIIKFSKRKPAEQKLIKDIIV